MAGFVGKVIYVSVDGEQVQCETSATLNMETSVNTISRCKGGSRFRKHVKGRNTWSIEVDANALLNNIATNQFTVLEAMMGEGIVNVMFQSDPTYYEHDEKFVIAGSAIITNFTWEAPSADGSTWNATFQGAGPIDIVREPNLVKAWSQDGFNAVINGRRRRLIYVTD
ncbi:MAG: hypothetical protein ACRDE7_00015 [Sphingobacterium sp.]